MSVTENHAVGMNAELLPDEDINIDAKLKRAFE